MEQPRPTSPEGARLFAARIELAAATKSAKDAVVRDVASGTSESEAARRYGLSRMTVRAALREDIS